MEPNRFGRKLGIGVRVASRMVKERAAQAAASASASNQAQPQAQPHSPPQSQPQPQAQSAAKTGAAASGTQRTAPASKPRPQSPPRKPLNYVEPARRVGEGTRRFGKAFLGPLGHVSRTLWLEITGMFFALFALFFAQNAYKTRASAWHGPQHAEFLLYCAITLVFCYFCVSSFWKAARAGRQRERGSTR
jgi:hypothetical protein